MDPKKMVVVDDQEEKAVAKQKPKTAVVQPEATESGRLVEMAINKDLDIDKLERVISMHREMKKEHNKEQFDIHFSKMQKEFTPIKRNKKGDKAKYAPVDDMIKKYGGIISNYGFSYSWDEIQNDDKSLTVVLTISGYGHDKKNSKLLPEYLPDKGEQSGKAIMNVLQAEGTRSTYGYRYTFKAGFGITETNEDTDGEIKLTFNDAFNYAEDITWLKSAKTKEDLKEVWGRIYKELKKNNDTIGKGILTEVYTNQKKAVTK